MRCTWPAIITAAGITLAEFGLQWITELWNPVLKVLYAQVGIGNGNASNTIQGDFVGLGTVPGMRACSSGNFAAFNTTAAGYEDNVISWPSVEPADDYTAASLFAFALGAAGLG